jgi:ATP-dependent DNA helicase
LKNMNCRLIKELLTYPSANRLLITGTPLQNNISELWSLLHFLLPDVFNDLNSFESWFDFSSVLDKNSQADLIEKRKRNLVSSMHAILKPFLLRRVKTDVEHSLPKKREYILYAPLSSEQKELYREIISGTGRQYLEAKALERLNAKSATQNQSQGKKRRRESSPESSSNKSAKTNGKKTPTRHTPSGRRRSVRTYKDISDEEFDSKLRNMEMGVEEEEEEEEESEEELEHKEQLKNLQLASTCLYLSCDTASTLTHPQRRKLARRRCRTQLCKLVWPAILRTTSIGLGMEKSTSPSYLPQARCSFWTVSSLTF